MLNLNIGMGHLLEMAWKVLCNSGLIQFYLGLDIYFGCVFFLFLLTTWQEHII